MKLEYRIAVTDPDEYGRNLLELRRRTQEVVNAQDKEAKISVKFGPELPTIELLRSAKILLALLINVDTLNQGFLFYLVEELAPFADVQLHFYTARAYYDQALDRAGKQASAEVVVANNKKLLELQRLFPQAQVWWIETQGDVNEFVETIALESAARVKGKEVVPENKSAREKLRISYANLILDANTFSVTNTDTKRSVIFSPRLFTLLFFAIGLEREARFKGGRILISRIAALADSTDDNAPEFTPAGIGQTWVAIKRSLKLLGPLPFDLSVRNDAVLFGYSHQTDRTKLAQESLLSTNYLLRFRNIIHDPINRVVINIKTGDSVELPPTASKLLTFLLTEEADMRSVLIEKRVISYGRINAFFSRSFVKNSDWIKTFKSTLESRLHKLGDIGFSIETVREKGYQIKYTKPPTASKDSTD